MANLAQHGPSDAPAARATILGELKASGYRSRSVKEELRHNLIGKLEADQPKFEGIVGFEETVVPQVENALLSGQDIIFLGERGQAKTRLARTLPSLLDEWLPFVAGCEINDDPLKPICWKCRATIAECGDATPIDWLPRDRRYGEKLATPDITIADLIGEVDPIKVAEGRYLSDELTIHFGLLPRTHRRILVINEPPGPQEPRDLAAVGCQRAGERCELRKHAVQRLAARHSTAREASRAACLGPGGARAEHRRQDRARDGRRSRRREGHREAAAEGGAQRLQPPLRTARVRRPAGRV